MKDVDIAKYQFDFDLVFAIIFMNADGRIYSRYGSRDALSDDRYVSLDGLKYTMRNVLHAHRTLDRLTATEPKPTPLFARELYPSRTGGCIHCHQVFEGLRREERRNGTFNPQSFYVYPLPKNVGLRLDVDQGNKVMRVVADSAASRAGIQAGDVIRRVCETEISSQADVMWALHNAPREGDIHVQFEREGILKNAVLSVEPGWKKTNLSWRASMRQESFLDD